MAALTRNATDRARTVSNVLKRMAARTDCSSLPTLRDCTSAECKYAGEPVRPAGPARVVIAASLSQILAGHQAQPRGQDLHDDRHEAGGGDHPEQAVAIVGPGLQVGAPVAGVHVADAD